MLASRLCRVPITVFVTSLGKQSVLVKPTQSCMYTRVQMYANQVKTGLGRQAKRQTLKEKLTAPATDKPFRMGQGLVAGASVVGLGALCFYGLGMSKEAGTIHTSLMWPEEVKKRVHDTYMYFGGSLIITAASAIAASRSPAMMRMMAKNSWMAIGATFAAMIGSGMVCRAIPYEPGFGSKQIAWMVHSGIMGAVVAPLMFLGGPLLMRAAWYTAGVVGGLSTIAVCAPSEKFLNMGGPLAIGLGLVFASSIGTWFLPPTTALGAGMYSVAVYGGLVLFGMFLLYDTQKVMKMAETYPFYAERKFDPVNASIGIYLDTLNIFIRIAMILAGNGGRKK